MMGRRRVAPEGPCALRKRAKEALGEYTGDVGSPSPKEVQDPAHRLAEYQTELEMQKGVLQNVRRELVAAWDRYAELYDSSPLGHVTVDDKGIIREANPAAARMLGRPRRSLLGHCFARYVARGHKRGFAAHLRKCIEGRGEVTFEVALTPGGGPPVPAELHSLPVRADKEGGTLCRIAITGVLDTFRDITRNKALAAQLLQSQKMEAIGHLAGGVAHDFRNQLTVIQGYARRLLRLALVKKEGSQDVREILKAAHRSADLTHTLLAFSRNEALRPQVVDLAEAVRDLCTSLQRMVGEDVRLSFAPPERPCHARLDPGQFQQAVVNLAVNAREAMPHGGDLTIEMDRVVLNARFVGRHPGARPGRHVRVVARDTGAGMDEHTLARIFDPFFTTKKAGEGTGLGLSTVYGFVRQTGGIIEVQSEPGKGATFRLYFPVADPALRRAKSAPPRGNLRTGTETILVVEDEADLRRLLVKALQEARYQVLEAASPREALSEVSRHEGRIDMLIADVVLGEMNGLELAETVRETRPEIVVLLISGYAGDDLNRRGVNGSDMSLLAKPFGEEELTRKVRQLLDAAGQGRQQVRRRSTRQVHPSQDAAGNGPP